MSRTAPSPPLSGRFSEVSPESEAFDYRLAWRRDDPALERDALGFWRAGPLPWGVRPEDRVKELCVVAYDEDGALAAVSTAVVRPMPFLDDARFAMFRVMVAPPYRRRNVSRVILDEIKAKLSVWSAEHPEARLMGVGTVIQSPVLAQSEPNSVVRVGLWPRTGMAVVGFAAAGELIRLVWFDHARL